jgi:hypothetical protein
MPPRIRDLKGTVAKGWIIIRPGKGSQTVWEHPLTPMQELLAGGDEDGAKPYQERCA